VTATGSTGRKSSTLYGQPVYHHRPRRSISGGPAIPACSAKSSRTRRTIADLTAQGRPRRFDLTSVTTYTKRDILVSRDASALTARCRSSRLSDRRRFAPSRLNDTTDFKGFTQELRLSSRGKGPLNGCLGAFMRHRPQICPRLPTPGYDAFTNVTVRRRNVGGSGHWVRPGFVQRPSSLQLKQPRCSASSAMTCGQPVEERRRPLLTISKEERRFIRAGCLRRHDQVTRRNRTLQPRYCLRTRCRRA